MSNFNKHIKIGLRVTVVLSLLIAGFWLWWDRTYGEVPESSKIWWPYMKEGFFLIIWREEYHEGAFQLYLSRWWDILLPIITIPFLVFAARLSRVYSLALLITIISLFFGGIEFLMPRILESSTEPWLTGAPLILGLLAGIISTKYKSWNLSFKELIFIRLFSWMLSVTFSSILCAGLVGGLPVGIAAGIYFSFNVFKWLLVGVIVGLVFIVINTLLSSIYRTLKNWLSGN